jgi:hypothetical protein
VKIDWVAEPSPGNACAVEITRGALDSPTDAAAVAAGLEPALRVVPGVTGVRRTALWSGGLELGVTMDRRVERDIALRRAAVDGFLAALDASRIPYAPLRVVDWLTLPYRSRHAPRHRDIVRLLGPDVARFERLQALRLPSIEPWLSGQRAVRDLAAFSEFHALGAEAQALVRLALADSRTGFMVVERPCPDGCHRSWAEPHIAGLAAAGWLHTSQGGVYLSAGPRIYRLNKAAGEPMAD